MSTVSKFPPPTSEALDALDAMLNAATVEPIGQGALRWAIKVPSGKHVEIEIGPRGEFISLATFWDDD